MKFARAAVVTTWMISQCLGLASPALANDWSNGPGFGHHEEDPILDPFNPSPRDTYRPRRPHHGQACELMGYGSHGGYTWNYRLAVRGTIWAAADSFSAIRSKMAELQAARVCDGPAFGSCSISGQGDYRGYNWLYILYLNGDKIGAADSYSAITQQMREMESAGFCAQSEPETCTIGGYGTYRGYSWNYIVYKGGDKFQATDTLIDLISKTNELQRSRTCVVRPRGECSLSPAGSYRGYSWNYLIHIGRETVAATDYLNEATNIMHTMRSAGYCY